MRSHVCSAAFTGLDNITPRLYQFSSLHIEWDVHVGERPSHKWGFGTQTFFSYRCGFGLPVPFPPCGSFETTMGICREITSPHRGKQTLTLLLWLIQTPKLDVSPV